MQRYRKLFIRTLLIVFVAWVGLVVWGVIYAWRPLPAYSPEALAVPSVPILTNKEYRVGHIEPYLVQAEIESNSGAVLIFGASHTNDPNHPSLAKIRNEFESFAPTVVLCEGRMTGLLFPGFMDPVRTFGEPGLVRKLAYASGCDLYTWEPTAANEVQGLLDQGFEEEQVALRIVLGPYFSNLRFGKPDSPESFVDEMIRKKKSWPVVGKAFEDATAVDEAWKHYFPAGPDWRNVSDEKALPGFLGEMDTNLVRDLHLYRILRELMVKGERVFVIAGSSHAVKLEKAVKSISQVARD